MGVGVIVLGIVAVAYLGLLATRSQAQASPTYVQVPAQLRS